MAFNFGKFVERHTRTLFAFIVVTMVLPLVLWGYMGKAGNEREEDQGEAGTIYGNIKISKGEYNRHLSTASASWWWKKFNDPMTMMMMRYGQQPQPPRQEELNKQAWEDIILLREAKAGGIQASEQETLIELREMYQKFTGRPDYSDEIMYRIAKEFFHVEFAAFMGWVADHVVIEKLLTLISDSEFADFDKVYDRVAAGSSMAKVWYAGFDPKEYLRELKPPTTDEITAYYGKNKEKYKVPGKVQVAYLLADAEALKKNEPEPSEADVKKYYDDNKVAEFAKAHEHHPGEEHKEDEKPEYKTFDDVKAEIPSKIKQRAADKKAAEIMNRVDVALGAITTANNNKYPDDAFDQLKAKFKAENVALTYDITNSFDAKTGVEEVEKIVGSGSTLGTWAFDPATKLGDVSQKVKTGKGVALFRLQKKIDPLDPGITERTRESIVKELQKEQIKKKVSQVANNVVQEIATHGMLAARRKYPVDWRVTRYFKTDGQDLGIDDAALAGGIAAQVRNGQMKAGKAVAVPGASLRLQDKADWSFVLYLEDLTDLPPDDVSSQFSGSRKGMDEEARRRYRQVYIDDTVKAAAVSLDDSLKNSGKASESSPKP
ncbi:MAG: hypothetical protein JO332_19200 [Planctomycetaceae bacterium]|nr:hypothetical protein [Planctomycetaceae bacterium]